MKYIHIAFKIFDLIKKDTFQDYILIEDNFENRVASLSGAYIIIQDTKTKEYYKWDGTIFTSDHDGMPSIMRPFGGGWNSDTDYLGFWPVEKRVYWEYKIR